MVVWEILSVFLFWITLNFAQSSMWLWKLMANKQMHRKTQTGRQIETGRQTETNRQTARQTAGQTDRDRQIETDRPRQTDRQTDKQAASPPNISHFVNRPSKTKTVCLRYTSSFV